MTAAVLQPPAVAGPTRDSQVDRPAPPGAVDGAGWLGLGAVVAKSCQTLVLLVFAAVLAPAEFGLISMAAVLLNATVVLADLGTSTALVQLRGDAERAARTALTVALAVSLGLLGLVWYAAPWLATTLHLGDQGSGVFRGIVVCLPLAAAAGVSAELLRRALDFRKRVLPDIVGNVVGALAAVAALTAGWGPFALVAGQLVQSAVILLLFWALRPPVVPGWSGADARALLRFGGSLTGSSVLTLVVLNVDYVLIARHLGADDVGVYSMAFRLAYMPYLLIAMVVGGAVFAHLSRMRDAAVGRAAIEATLLVQSLVVPLYAGILVLAPQLELLGHDWAPAVTALRWLAVYGLLLSALELVVVTLKSVGRTTDILALTGLHLALLLVLLLSYVDRGVTAVAVCQVVAGAITLVAAGLVVRRRVRGIDLVLLARRLGPVVAGSGALVITALALDRILPTGPVSLVGLLVIGPAALTAYLLTVRALDPADHTGLARTLRLRLQRPGRPNLRGPLRAVATGIAGVGIAIAVGTLAVVAPVAALITLAAGVVLAATAYRLEWAALLLVATEPFGDLLRDVHPAAVKAVGLLLFASWALRLLVDPRPSIPRHPGLAAVGALVLVALGSFVANGADLEVALDHGMSYLAYALVVLVVVDTMRRRGAVAFGQRLGACFFLACTGAAVVGVVTFLAEGGRAAGPLEDANDLAFFLVAALPFGLVVARRRSRAVVCAATACAAVLVVATFATFSRGALLALLLMVAVAVAIRAVRPGAVVTVSVATAAVLGVAWLTHGAVVDRGIAEKDHVAAENVDSRLTTWTMAGEMTADSPLLGKGPGGFEDAAAQYLPVGVGAVEQTVVHNMYLDVAAELGLLALTAFLAAIAYGVRGAVRARRLPERRALADAVVLAFTGTLVAACFLSEQLYLPVWLLIALGIGLDPGRSTAVPEEGW